jgi:hypothetical protein
MLKLSKDDYLANGQIMLSRPQFELVTTDKKYPAFVGGFGSGKTAALLDRCITRKIKYPKNDFAYYFPTYDLVSIVGFPRFEERLTELKIPYQSRTGTKPRIEVENCGQILFRNMDNPGRIVGYEVADSFIDEIDTMKTEDAKEAWKKIVARNRQKKFDGSANTIAVGTTPEGFKFVYDQWKAKPPSDDYYLIKASTRSNAHNLPDDYIQNMIDTYPDSLVSAYIDGEFTNLKSGAVYPNFDRTLNGTNFVINVEAKEPLHIGQDFNVTKMASVVWVIRDGQPYAVDELSKLFDTPQVISVIKQRYPGHPIFIYPDASGSARDSNNASASDLDLFRAAGFNVFVNNRNPFVKDRILSMNIMICNGKQERRLKVNIDKCPAFVEGLEKQAYDKNVEPDKTSGVDHSIDAGYFIAYRFPVVSGLQRVKVSGT